MISIKLNKYNIAVGDVLTSISDFMTVGDYTGSAILADEHTRRHCLPLLAARLPAAAPVIEIPAGEAHKNLETCQYVWQEMLRLGLDRRGLLVCLGGGVAGDLGGFCAATYLRGISFAQVPTSLLAMADSSIGGKVGIDFKHVKNIIGVFSDPAAVFIHPEFLKTLPPAELYSGFAEIFKHALIADAGLWKQLVCLEDIGRADWLSFLPASLRVKQRIVEADPHERGLRKALNFGHTIGHAVESLSLQRVAESEREPSVEALRHGEAVALGIICESWLSWKCSTLSEADLSEITGFVLRFYKPFPIPDNDFPQLLDLMRKDKKNIRGRINFSLLPGIGDVATDQYCGEDLVLDSLRYYREVCGG
jgi:3-dehydroquinate synthase